MAFAGDVFRFSVALLISVVIGAAVHGQLELDRQIILTCVVFFVLKLISIGNDVHKLIEIAKRNSPPPPPK